QEWQLASLHLLLHRSGLAPPTPCRSPGALRVLSRQPASPISTSPFVNTAQNGAAPRDEDGNGTVVTCHSRVVIRARHSTKTSSRRRRILGSAARISRMIRGRSGWELDSSVEAKITGASHACGPGRHDILMAKCI